MSWVSILVRLTLLPVILRLTGRAAWYLPAWLDRLLPEIHFGHGGDVEGTAGAAPVESRPLAETGGA